jgi:pSer/pThr/pTyr-binding forkhead associated (FHA) protein
MAYLTALTPEVERVLGGTRLLLGDLPLRVGRDLRRRRRFRLRRDRRRGLVVGPNDLYIPEAGPRYRLSREHFLIGRDDAWFFVEDRHSACGTLVAERIVGGGRNGGRERLRDGDTILAGGRNSPFAFRFHAGD